MAPLIKERVERRRYDTRGRSDALQEQCSPDVHRYILKFMPFGGQEAHVRSASGRSAIETIPSDSIRNIVNLQRVNDVRFINKFFEAVNAKLIQGRLFIGCFEEKKQRKERIFRQLPSVLAYLVYALDFLLHRVVPKLRFLQPPYFALTKGRNRALSLTEMLGRLVCCGFEIVDYTVINGLTYFTARKIKAPAYDCNPTYGPLIRLNRIGKDGNRINVYKIRTMHPFAEYLQEFIYERNDLQKGGKFRNDFRITQWGQFLRKIWFDELPMLYNWLKGEIKLVGIRPLSDQYLSLYPRSFIEKRLKYKPGLVPPFYVDLPTTLEEIIASENKYLEKYDQAPVLTDIKYFFKSIYNIVINNAHSH